MFQSVLFGKGGGQELTDRKISSGIMSTLENRYNLNKITHKNFQFLGDNDLYVLKKYRHMVCFNTKQRPILLFLTRINNVNHSLYINREKGQIISVNHNFADDYYNDTLLEGEQLLNTDTGPMFLISDLLVYCGESTERKSLTDRLKLLDQMMASYVPYQNENFQIAVKDFVDYQYLESFVKQYLKDLPYRNLVSGIIFRPVSRSNKNIIVVLNKQDFHKINTQKYSAPRQESVSERKVKINPENSPVDFELRITDMSDVYDLCLINSSGDKYRYGIACVPDLELSLWLRSLFVDSQMPRIVKCEYVPRFKKWRPVGLSDSDSPAQIENIKF